jgi:hypothetical protein
MPERPESHEVETLPAPDPNEQLVRIFDTESEAEAMVVKGLLDSAGIENDITALSVFQGAFPSIGGTILLVREEDAQRARLLIAAYKQAPSIDDETAEVAIIDLEDPPAKA